MSGTLGRRVGIEFSNYYRVTRWLTVDADVAYARARFRDVATNGDGQFVDGAVEGVASLALAVDNLGPYYGAIQGRYFGPRPLDTLNSVRSQSTLTFNGRIGYKITKAMRIQLEGYNLANRRANAIDYYYASRLASEPAGQDFSVTEKHFHPIESRSFRITLIANF